MSGLKFRSVLLGQIVLVSIIGAGLFVQAQSKPRVATTPAFFNFFQTLEAKLAQARSINVAEKFALGQAESFPIIRKLQRILSDHKYELQEQIAIAFPEEHFFLAAIAGTNPPKPETVTVEQKEVLDLLQSKKDELKVCEPIPDFFLLEKKYPRIYEFDRDYVLIELICQNHRNPLLQYFLYSRNPNRLELIPLKFESANENDSGNVVLEKRLYLHGKRTYDWRRRTINLTETIGGMRLSGTFERHQWYEPERRFILLEFRLQLDGQEFIDPREYPLVYKRPLN